MNGKKVYKLVETEAYELGEWGEGLTEDQINDVLGCYDKNQFDALALAYPEITFVEVDPGQVFQAQAHNSRLEEADYIHDFIVDHFADWLQAAVDEAINQETK